METTYSFNVHQGASTSESVGRIRFAEPVLQIGQTNGCIEVGNRLNNELIDSSSSEEADDDDGDDDDGHGDDDDGDEDIPNEEASQFFRIGRWEEAVVSRWNPAPYNPIFNVDGEFHRGQQFDSKKDLEDALNRYTLYRSRRYEVKESKLHLLDVKCKWSANCGWRLRARKKRSHGRFEISIYGTPHTCVQDIHNRRNNIQLSSKTIAASIENMVREDPTIKISVIGEHVQNLFQHRPPYKILKYAKHMALASIFGKWDESYAQLPRFLSVLQQTNPGMVFFIQNERIDGRSNEYMFFRVFWAFHQCKEAFRHCRPLISINATHMYGKYKGKMLIALGIDGNDQLLPLAFAIVEDSENQRNWGWFLKNLRDHVVGPREEICLISDRHPGILAAIADRANGWCEPMGYHRFCLRHMCSNFNACYKDGTLKNWLYRAGAAHQISKFNAIMERIHEVNASAYQWIMNVELSKWSRAHDGGRRFGVLTTNMNEGFNGVLKGVRNLPITAVVRLIFYRLVSYFYHRSAQGGVAVTEGNMYTPTLMLNFEKEFNQSKRHNLYVFDRRLGEVQVITARRGHRGGHTQIVSMQNRTCTCGKFQMYGFPCSHALAACDRLALQPSEYISYFYTLDAYTSTWGQFWHPFPDEAYWAPTTLILRPNPALKRGVGRPKTSRIHNEMDQDHSRRCGICRQTGHNRRYCPGIGN